MKALGKGLAMAALLIAGMAGWTEWLDPWWPSLPVQRAKWRQTSLGQQLLPAPEPHWVVQAGRDRETCLREARGELSERYVTCRRGVRRLIRETGHGEHIVLREELLPESDGDLR